MKPKISSSYKQLNPSNELKDFIYSYWESKNLTNKTLKRTVFPDSFFKIYLELKDDKVSTLLLIGLFTKENEIEIPANTTVYGIKFKILAPEYIFQKEIASLLNSQEVLDPSFWGIKDMNLVSLQNFVSLIEPVILKKINQNKEPQKKKLNLSKLLYNSNGNILVKDISKQVNWNSRSINRYFTKYIGIPLKTYLNIQKVYAAYIPIINKKFFPEKGFHDQSHFIKEVKKHTNNTPSELEDQKNDRFIQLKNIKK